LYLDYDTRGFEGQDQSIFWLAEKRERVVILVNKWDLVEKETCQEIMKKKSGRINAIYGCLFFLHITKQPITEKRLKLR
jgi:predicted GTPase